MEQLSVKPYGIRYGLISGAIAFAFSIGIYTAGISPTSSLGYLIYVIYIGILVVAMRQYKADNQGFMKFKSGLGLGVLASLISGALSGALLVLYTFIDGNYIANILEFMRAELEKQAALNPAMSDEVIEMSMGMYENYLFTPLGLLVSSIFSGVLGGLIVSLILAAILKKDPPEYIDSEDVLDNEN